jgi:uncharacterized membrane protein
VANSAMLPATFAEVQHIVQTRCHVCHSVHPSYPGFSQAPKGVMFDTPAEIATLSQQIYAQAVKTHTMPLNNITRITEAERDALGAWITDGSKVN